MKLHHQLLTVAVAAALYVPAAHAEVAIDVIGGSEITFEGLVQADGNWFDNDVVDLNGGDAGNGKDSEFELRAAPSWCSRARARATWNGWWATTPRPTSSWTPT